jgi:hypothetical protein
MDILNHLDGGQTVLALLIICLTIVALAKVIADPFTRSGVDEDELADRIEAAIKDATVDLLDALSSVEDVATRAADALDRIDERHAEQFKPVRMEKLPDV